MRKRAIKADRKKNKERHNSRERVRNKIVACCNQISTLTFLSLYRLHMVILLILVHVRQKYTLRKEEIEHTKERRKTINLNKSQDAKQTLAHLDIHDVVVGAGGQQEALCCVSKLTVVDLLFMLLLKDP